MQLISDIINELVDSEKSISSPLLKTKVLATRLKNQELLTWVNNELNGYSDLNTLPEYRISYAQVTGVFRNGNMLYTDHPLPTAGLPEDIAKMFLVMEFSQSVTTLESLIEKNKRNTNHVETSFPSEYNAILQENLRRMGNRFLSIISAKKSVPATVVTQMLTVIRSKLLDFMLKVDEEFGNITELDVLKTKNERITTIMNTTINNTGDGNIVNTGANASIKAKININKNDKQSLRDVLKEQNVPEADIDKLIKIIDAEQPNREKGTFGKQVNVWIQSMVGKALDGSWQIATGAAGGLLVEVMKGYYGM